MARKFIWLSALALILTLGQSSFAYSGDDKQGKSHHRLDTLAKELDLTPDQKEKIKAYKQQARTTFKESYSQLRSLRSQITAQVLSDKMDETKVNNLVEQVNKIRSSMLKSKIMMQHRMFSILNDKQKAKFLELKQKWLKSNP